MSIIKVVFEFTYTHHTTTHTLHGCRQARAFYTDLRTLLNTIYKSKSVLQKESKVVNIQLLAYLGYSTQSTGAAAQ